MTDQFFKLWEDNQSLKELEKRAKKDHIPIISRDTANFIKSVLLFTNPKLILEVGTAIGYSTLWLAEYSDPDCEIVTIERDEARLIEAKENIKEFKFTKKVNFKYGDALEILPYLRRKFDLIFIDAAKGQYLNLFKMAEEKITDNGIILCDNVLYKGLVKDKGKLDHKMRTIVVNMRKFLIYLKNNQKFDSRLFDIDDGLTISIRR
ncbi:MAG: O-methyltransferase [Bacillota bacterium]